MEKQTGCVHIYCGDGKGKTTCGMGLCTRAAGYGYRVLIYQFMKDNSTSERKVLLLSPNVTFVPVSYTHLDVYKRQVLCRGRRLEVR